MTTENNLLWAKMTHKEQARAMYCQQYAHSVLYAIAAGHNLHWRTCGEFEDAYTLISIDYEIASVLEMIGMPAEHAEDITSIMAMAGDGDYLELWFSESSRPWSLTAVYRCAEFYAIRDYNPSWVDLIRAALH